MPLLDDFIMSASDASSPGLFHQCIVTELVMCLSDDWYERKIMGSIIRQIMDAFDFLHSHRVIPWRSDRTLLCCGDTLESGIVLTSFNPPQIPTLAISAWRLAILKV